MDRAQWRIGALHFHKHGAPSPMLRVETVMKSVLDQISPGSWIRLREIDTTDLRADGEFFAKMVTAGVYQPEEVKAILDEVLG